MAADISRLISALSWWEFAGYVDIAAVALGVAGESVHEFTNWMGRYPWWTTKGGKASALLLIAALAAELLIQIKVNSTSGQIIAALNDQAADTRERAAALEKDAAKARERTAELEMQLQARSIDADEFKRVIGDIARVNVEILYGEGSDTWWLAFNMTGLLRENGWSIPSGFPKPLTADDSEGCKRLPTLTCMGGQPFGITILTGLHASAEEEIAALSLMRAFAASLLLTSEVTSYPKGPIGAVRIIVGPKP